MDKIYVLDSTVFIEGYAAAFLGKNCVITYEVMEELKNEKTAIEVDRFLKSGLDLIVPSSSAVKEIEKVYKRTNDKFSKADISVIALAYEFKSKKKEVVVVSDDYAIQNVCKFLDIEFLPVSKKGIKKKFKWKRICKACRNETDKEVCETCGYKTVFVPETVD